MKRDRKRGSASSAFPDFVVSRTPASQDASDVAKRRRHPKAVKPPAMSGPDVRDIIAEPGIPDGLAAPVDPAEPLPDDLSMDGQDSSGVGVTSIYVSKRGHTFGIIAAPKSQVDGAANKRPDNNNLPSDGPRAKPSGGNNRTGIVGTDRLQVPQAQALEGSLGVGKPRPKPPAIRAKGIISSSDLVGEGWTFRIDGVSDIFTKQFKDNKKQVRAVDIILSGSEGNDIFRTVLISAAQNTLEREAFLQKVQIDRENGVDVNLLYRFADTNGGTVVGNTPHSILIHSGNPIPSTFVDAECNAPEANNFNSKLETSFRAYSTKSYPYEIIGVHDGVAFARGGITDKNGLEIPITVCHFMRGYGDKAEMATSELVRAHIRVNLRLMDKLTGTRPETTLELDIVHSDGRKQHVSRGLRELTSDREDYFQTLFSGDTLNITRNGQDKWKMLFNLLQSECRNSAERQDVLGWHATETGLSWLASDCVHNLSGIQTFAETRLYPPIDASATEKQFGLDTITLTASEAALKLLLVELNPAIIPVVSGLLGYHFRVMVPYATSDDKEGKAQFVIEVEGASGLGKSPLISNFQLFAGCGYGKYAPTQLEALGSTRGANIDLPSKFPSRVAIGPDLKTGGVDRKKVLEIRTRIQQLYSDDSVSHYKSRLQKMMSRPVVMGGEVHTCEQDFAPERIKAGFASDEHRTMTLRFMGSKSNESIGEKLNAKKVREALASVGFQFRKWIIAHDACGTGEGLFLSNGVKARELCAEVRKISDRHGLNVTYVVTGLLQLKSFFADIYPGSFLNVWIDAAIPEFICNRLERTKYLWNEVPQELKADNSNLITQALLKITRDGTAYLNCDQKMYSVVEPYLTTNGYDRESLGYRFDFAAKDKWKPVGARIGIILPEAGGQIAFQAGDFNPGGFAYEAIRIAFKVNERGAINAADIADWLNNHPNALKDVRGGNPKLRTEGQRSRHYVIPLSALYQPTDRALLATPAGSDTTPANVGHVEQQTHHKLAGQSFGAGRLASGKNGTKAS